MFLRWLFAFHFKSLGWNELRVGQHKPVVFCSEASLLKLNGPYLQKSICRVAAYRKGQSRDGGWPAARYDEGGAFGCHGGRLWAGPAPGDLWEASWGWRPADHSAQEGLARRSGLQKVHCVTMPASSHLAGPSCRHGPWCCGGHRVGLAASQVGLPA